MTEAELIARAKAGDREAFGDIVRRYQTLVASLIYSATGDLGRWRSNGTIEFLGRNDHQTKIRGFRIELGEIEALLGQHPDIKSAVVVLRDVQGLSNEEVADVVGESVACVKSRLHRARMALREQLTTALAPLPRLLA